MATNLPRILALMALGAWLGCHAPGPAEDGPDVAHDVPADVAKDPCGLEGLVVLFDDHVVPHLTNCHTCHDMSGAPSLLKIPGPPWYHPTNTLATVVYVLEEGLIDGRDPELSLLVLKPLFVSDGGANHPGGDYFSKDHSAYDDFLTFVEAAAPCVGKPPPR